MAASASTWVGSHYSIPTRILTFTYILVLPGNEIFDVHKQPLQSDFNHLFIRQGTGQPPWKRKDPTKSSR
jgi:hypothetical protein